MFSVRLPHAVRALARTPLVSIVAVVSLALGIGANAAIFSLFDQLLLRPLPVAHPEQLVNLSAPGPKPGSQSCGQAGECDAVFSYPMIRDLQRVQTPFTGIAAHRAFRVNLAYRGQTLSGDGALVTGTYFPVLGLSPAIGRLLDATDDEAVGEPHVVVLSYEYWRTRFGQRPDVLNQPLVVNGHSLTIVGVAPRGFTGTVLGGEPHVFVPMTLRDQMEPMFGPSLEQRRSYWAYAFARLKPGVSVAQAATAINVPYRAIIHDVEAPLQRGMSDHTMKQFRARRVMVEADPRGQSRLHREARTPLVLLMSVTGLVLLIACANIANLLLARAVGRSAEMAVRLSIGAGRWRLVRQLLAEAGVLALAGGALSLPVARWTLDLVGSMMPAEAVGTVSTSVDGRVAAFAAAVAAATALMFGLFPALHSTRPDLVGALKGQQGQPSGGRTAAWFRSALVTAQIALSMLLLAGAGLFVRSLFNVSRVELGVKTDHIATFGVSPQLNGYAAARSLDLFERLEDELGAVPGVTGVTASMVPLLAGSSWASSVTVEGFPSGPDTDTSANYTAIGPAYFRTLGVPLIVGREFSRTDAASAAPVAVVNEAFTRKFNLGRNPLGKHVQQGGQDTPQMVIVGVAADAKYNDVKDAPPPQFYTPYRQGETPGFLTFYVKTSLPPDRILPTIAKIVARLDPNLPVERLRTLDDQIRETVFVDRLLMLLSVSFAALATLLAAVGLYGVLAYAVALRTREIGLRMALGAAPRRVRRMVLGQVAVMTAIGAAVGLGLAAMAGRGAQSMLFGLKGYDPAVFALSAALLALVALGAGLVPALRASRVDPMAALRCE